MHAVGVEAIPARTFGATTVAVPVELHALVEDVMFARNVMHVEPGLRDDAVGVVEFGRLGEMGDIAGMNDERWLHAKRPDLADRFLERAEGVGIGRLVEPDMTVADLQEGQPARFGSRRLADNAHRARDTATSADAALIVVIRSHRRSP